MNLFDFDVEEDARAQVGIGILIIIIATVLIAGFAANTLINTSGDLQESAETTGDQTESEVTDRLGVKGSVGLVDNQQVDEIQMTVEPQSGSGEINLNELTLEYLNEAGGTSATLQSRDAVSSPGSTATFDTEVISTSAPPVVTGTTDQTGVSIEVATTASDVTLQEGDVLTDVLDIQSGTASNDQLLDAELTELNSFSAATGGLSSADAGDFTVTDEGDIAVAEGSDAAGATVSGGDTFTVGFTEVTDTEPRKVLTEPGDKAEIQINLDQSDTALAGAQLAPSATAETTLDVSGGGKSVTVHTVPDPLAGQDVVSLSGS